jgi:hypothetical protein
MKDSRTSCTSCRLSGSCRLVFPLLQLLLVLQVPVVHGFATYLLSRSGCLTDLDTTEVIMNYKVLQQPQAQVQAEEEEVDADADHARMQLVLHQPNEKVIQVSRIDSTSTIWIDVDVEHETPTFPMTINLQLLPENKNAAPSEKNGDYQFVLETALLDENGQALPVKDNAYSFFPKGSCDKHKRVAGRQAEVVSIVIAKEPPPPPSSTNSKGGGGVAVWAGWAAEHEAVTISTPLYIRLATAETKAAAAAAAKAAAAEAKLAAAAKAAAEGKAALPAGVLANGATADNNTAWSDFILSDTGCHAIDLSQTNHNNNDNENEPAMGFIIQGRRVLSTTSLASGVGGTSNSGASGGHDEPSAQLPPTLHLKVLSTNEITTAGSQATVFEFDIMATTQITKERHIAAAASEAAFAVLLPRTIVLDVQTTATAATGLNVTWRKPSLSSSSSSDPLLTLACGGRRVRIVPNPAQSSAAFSSWPVVKMFLAIPKTTTTKKEKDEDASSLLLHRGIFIRGVYDIAGNDDTLYRTTTLDLSWKPDNDNDNGKDANHNNKNEPLVPPKSDHESNPAAAAASETTTAMAYKELLKQQHATAHHEPRGQAAAAAKIHHAPPIQQQQQHDRIDVKRQKKDTDETVQQRKEQAKREDQVEQRHRQHLLAVQASNAPRELEEPKLDLVPQQPDGQGLLRRHISNIFMKDSRGNSTVHHTHRHRRAVAAGAAAADDPVEAFVHGKEAYFWGMAVWIVGMLFTIQGCRFLASRRGKGRRDL